MCPERFVESCFFDDDTIFLVPRLLVEETRDALIGQARGGGPRSPL